MTVTRTGSAPHAPSEGRRTPRRPSRGERAAPTLAAEGGDVGEHRTTGTRQAEPATPRPARRAATAGVALGLWAGVGRAAARAVGRWAARSRRRLVGTILAVLLGSWLTVGWVAPTAFVSVSVRPDERHQPAEVVVHNWSPSSVIVGPAGTTVQRLVDGDWVEQPHGALAYGVQLRPLLHGWTTGVPGADALEPGPHRVVVQVEIDGGPHRGTLHEVTTRFEVHRPDGWERGVPPPGPEQGVWWLHG